MISSDLPPPVIIERTDNLALTDPHIVLQLQRVFFGRPLLRERPRQHEFGFEHRPSGFDHAVEGRGHLAHDRMLHPALDPGEDLTGIAFKPVSVEGFGDHPELDDKIAGEVLGLDLAALFPPQAD